MGRDASAALTALTPALSGLARRLVSGKQRVGEDRGGVYEVSGDDLARWLADVAGAVAVEGRAAVARAGAAAAWEREQLAVFADELEGQVGGVDS